MIDCEIIALEDGNKYIIIDKIQIENNIYIYLENEKDEKDFCIRKQLIDNEEEFIVPLDNEEEFNKAIKIFGEKNNK